jgi:1,4-alpha-glucan branching enzyme
VAVTVQRASDQTAYVRFALPEQDDDGAVSVVGTFNDWTPGAHQMQVDDDGGLSIMIEVPYGQEIHFRYLGEDGRWFDDADADISEDGGHVAAMEPGEPETATTPPASVDLEASVVDLSSKHVPASRTSISRSENTNEES